MTETAIDLALPLLPSLMLGWVNSVSVSDGQMEREPWYAGWLRFLPMFAACEGLGFVLCRFVYRIGAMLL